MEYGLISSATRLSTLLIMVLAFSVASNAECEFAFHTAISKFQISKFDMQFVRSLPARGGNNAGIEIWSRDGRLVVVKRLLNDLEGSSREIRWNQLLSELKITPRFHGFLDEAGRIALVTDYVSIGAETAFLSEAPPSFRVFRSTLQRLIEIGKELEREGIRSADNFQFIISSDGREVFLIDVELLGKRGSSPVSEINAIVKSLERRFSVVEE